LCLVLLKIIPYLYCTKPNTKGMTHLKIKDGWISCAEYWYCTLPNFKRSVVKATKNLGNHNCVNFIHFYIKKLFVFSPVQICPTHTQKLFVFSPVQICPTHTQKKFYFLDKKWNRKVKLLFRGHAIVYLIHAMKKYGGGRRGIDPLMEFLDNGDTCITLPVSKRKFSIILQTNIHYYIQATFRELLISSTINQQMHLYNFHLKHFKTLKTTPKCFDLFRSSSGSFVVPC